MLTFKLNIKQNSLQKEDKAIIKNYCENYSFLFRKLFVNFEKLKENKQEYLDFKDKYQRKYNLDSWFFESCKNEVETKIAQESTQTEKRESKIKSIENELKNTIFNTKKEKRRKFNLQNSLKYLQKRKTKKITFGGKYLLQKISFLANDKAKNEIELKKNKKEFQKKRILPIFSIGETPQKSNRKFVFDFTNKKITFKPNKNTKVNFEFNCSKNQEKTLKKLQNFIGKMPFSVRLDKKFIWISLTNKNYIILSLRKKNISQN